MISVDPAKPAPAGVKVSVSPAAGTTVERGASVEFFLPEVPKLEEEIAKKYRFDATRHTFQIYGICEDCRKKAAGRRA